MLTGPTGDEIVLRNDFAAPLCQETDRLENWVAWYFQLEVTTVPSSQAVQRQLGYRYPTYALQYARPSRREMEEAIGE